MINTETGPQALTYAEYKAKKKRRELIHPLVLDQSAVERYAVAKDRLDKARIRGGAARLIAEYEAEVAEAEQAAREATILFRLRAMAREGDNSFAVLKAEHPPTKADHEKAQADSGDPKAKADWCVETFGPALVAACLVDPEMTPEQVIAESREMNESEWGGLVNAAIAVNTQATPTAGLLFS